MILLSIVSEEISHVGHEERFTIEDLGEGIHRLDRFCDAAAVGAAHA